MKGSLKIIDSKSYVVFQQDFDFSSAQNYTFWLLDLTESYPTYDFVYRIEFF